MRRWMVENIFGQMRPHSEALAFFKDRFKSWPDDWTQLENSVWRARGVELVPPISLKKQHKHFNIEQNMMQIVSKALWQI